MAIIGQESLQRYKASRQICKELRLQIMEQLRWGDEIERGRFAVSIQQSDASPLTQGELTRLLGPKIVAELKAQVACKTLESLYVTGPRIDQSESNSSSRSVKQFSNASTRKRTVYKHMWTMERMPAGSRATGLSFVALVAPATSLPA
jgi:hypothetical protein